jgi:hypothetical protein
LDAERFPISILAKLFRFRGKWADNFRVWPSP